MEDLVYSRIKKILDKNKNEADKTLAFKVWSAIILREKRKTLIKEWSFSLFGFISLVALVPAFSVLVNNLKQSGFFEYWSLIFSNTGSMFTYSKELSYSLLESLPVMSIALNLSLLFFFFFSMKYLMRQIAGPRLNVLA